MFLQVEEDEDKEKFKVAYDYLMPFYQKFVEEKKNKKGLLMASEGFGASECIKSIL